MDYSPDKLDPTKLLRQEIEMQETTAQNFFVYLGHFKQRMEFLELPEQSSEILSYLEQLVEKRNHVCESYRTLKNDFEDDSLSKFQKKIMVNGKHNDLQKDIIDIMENQIVELSCMRLPKDLAAEIKDEVNEYRTKIINTANRIKDEYYNNDLGKGGEAVLV